MFKFLTVTALGLLATTAVHAESDYAKGKEERRAQKEHFAPMDFNKDGFVTKAEMQKASEQRLNEHFKEMDANSDGKLSQEEMRKGRKEMHKKMKERMGDRKGPGGEEFEGRPRFDGERPPMPERGERGPRFDQEDE